MGKVAQKAIIFKEDKVLLVRDPRDPEVIWELPGGRLNSGENPKQGLVRELKEELGTEFKIGNVIYSSQFWHKRDEVMALVLVYLAEMADSSSTLVPDKGEICEYGWFGREEVMTMTMFKEYKEALIEFFAQK